MRPARVTGGTGDQFSDPRGRNTPLRLKHLGDAPVRQDAPDERLVPRNLGQSHVLDGVAVRPVANVVHEGGGDERRRVGIADDLREPRFGPQPLQELERQAIDAQRVLKPRVHRTRVDQRHEAELRDAGEPPHLGRVEQRPHPWCEGCGIAGRNAHAGGG